MTQAEQPQTIEGVILAGLADAMDTTKELFGIDQDDNAKLVPLLPIVQGMRLLTKPSHEPFVIPFVKQILEQIGAPDPAKNNEDFEHACNYADVIGSAISDAAGMIMQQMQAEAQRRAMTEQAIATGNPGLIT